MSCSLAILFTNYALQISGAYRHMATFLLDNLTPGQSTYHRLYDV